MLSAALAISRIGGQVSLRIHPVPTSTQTRHLTASDDDFRQSFASLIDRDDVVRLLEVTDSTLIYLLYRPRPRYTTFTVPKRGGGIRKIMAPVGSLKIVQQKLNQVLNAVYRVRPSVHGFAIDRNVKTNALPHVGKRWVLNIDLLDFFPSITFPRVRGMFMGRPYAIPERAATVLAQICCKDSLPQGAPTSPVVSNMICGKMDSELRRLATHYRCVYTRYADDMTFSCNSKEFPADLATTYLDGEMRPIVTVGDVLVKAIQANHFSINNSKSTLRGHGTRLAVTNVTVNEFPNVPRTYIRQARSMLHAWRKYGVESADDSYRASRGLRPADDRSRGQVFRRVVLGKLEYVRMMKGDTDPVYINLKNRLADADPRYPRVPTIVTEQQLGAALWVVVSQRGEEIRQGTAFMLQGFGLVTCDHVILDRTEVYQISDPTNAFDATPVKRNGHIDLAILSIDQKPEAQFTGAGRAAILGEDVTLIGFPNLGPGDTERTERGHVTGLRTRFGVKHILISPTIYSGHSGSPVLDAELRVIGIAQRGIDYRNDDPDAIEPSAIAIDEVNKL
ncbi:MAG: trypsin-like peptidase domain-containing protein [Chloroflexi bacterium]|nr:trypsin-like peptidase domain-containing protein [Chloroflexota bacterium]